MWKVLWGEYWYERKEKEDERGKYLLGNIYAVYDLSGAKKRRKARYKGKNSVEKGWLGTRVKPLRFIADFMA